VSSFGAVALLGTLLLMLPASSRTGGWSAPEDCLFTATSAVCVTGLIVKSPAHWSPSGQLVILALIQAGGLGIMTLGAFVAFMVRRRMSMRFEAFMTDMVEPEATQSVWPLIRFVCLFTLFAEAIGAFVLFWAWRSHFKSAWLCLCHSVFHAVSAFCNAGFSLNKDNLVGYVDDSGVNLTICLLIVIGGIGFSVVRDVQRYCRWWMFQRRGRRPHLSEHSKLALLVTGVLLLVGFVAFFVLESGYTLRNAPLKTRVLASMFQSVTPRTAGYNTVDTAACALPTSLLTMVLMFIGGSPGGTAGGIKTTTLGVMIASVLATLRGRRRAEVFGHSVPEETVHRTASIILLSVGALIAVVFLLLLTETAPFEPVVFDAVSAFGTVGLSRGFTGPDCDVTAWGKLLLTFLMFVGRLGPITLVLSVARRNERAPYSYPEGQVLVG
jgi:trk system potassium uptake protein TrkH